MTVTREEIVKAVSTLKEALATEEGKKIIQTLNVKFEFRDENNLPRVTYSEDKKHAFFNGHSYRLRKDGYYHRETRVHIDVMEYYLGKSVCGLSVHHDGKNEDGKFDKSKNDIEYLKLLTRSEHMKLHNETAGMRVCIVCGKNYLAKNQYTKRCEECQDEVNKEVHRKSEQRRRRQIMSDEERYQRNLEYMRNWRARNREKIKEYSKRYLAKKKATDL